jgi:MerR family transcriptional regulator, redox-sensitive transcriptional activator SoxR
VDDNPTLTIGQVADRAGVNSSAIRYYESVGVLPKPERVSGQRRYCEDTVDRLGLIGAAQKAGFTLDEITDLLRSSDEGHASDQMRELARRKLPDVEALIDRAQRMKRWLEVASDCGCSTLEACALFADGDDAIPELNLVTRSAS